MKNSDLGDETRHQDRCFLLELLQTVLPVLHRLLVGDLKEDESECEEDREGSDGDVDRSAGELDGRDDRGAEEARALGEDIVETEVLAGVLRRDDL